MSWLKIEGKVAVVTGAGRGIGAEIACELARNGARVAALDINAEGAAETARDIEQLGGESVADEVDTTDETAVGAASRRIIDRWGQVDILVNNAGTSIPKPLAEVPLAEWERVLAINLTGYLLCSQVFGAFMRNAGTGSLVHVASVCGHQPLPNAGSYSPSKAGVLMLSRALALEWGPYGVRSNCLSPGMTRTPLTEANYQVPGVLDRRSSLAPLRRIATSQDMADACAWLASDRASYVTGQDITVDGGISQTAMAHTSI